MHGWSDGRGDVSSTSDTSFEFHPPASRQDRSFFRCCFQLQGTQQQQQQTKLLRKTSKTTMTMMTEPEAKGEREPPSIASISSSSSLSSSCDSTVDNDDDANNDQQKKQHEFVKEIITNENNQDKAWIIDSSLSDEQLNSIDKIRLSLKLDSKRPTVDRRFYVDKDNVNNKNKNNDDDKTNNDEEFSICNLLQTTIQRILGIKENACFVFHYLRFLEYTKFDGTQKLAPHTDGCKVCDVTGYQSTHTLLLYLTTIPSGNDECDDGSIGGGGETLLLKHVNPPKNNNPNDPTNDDNIIYAVKPRRGRMLLFPHKTPHSGEPLQMQRTGVATASITPKICLRAEVCLI